MHQSVFHNAPFYNRNVHRCAHFCYKMEHYGIFVWSEIIVSGLMYWGSVRWIYSLLSCHQRSLLNFLRRSTSRHKLTHWGLVTQTGSVTGLSFPVRHQHFTWTNDDLLLIGSLEINRCGNWIHCSPRKWIWKCRLQYGVHFPSLNVVTIYVTTGSLSQTEAEETSLKGHMGTGPGHMTVDAEERNIFNISSYDLPLNE